VEQLLMGDDSSSDTDAKEREHNQAPAKAVGDLGWQEQEWKEQQTEDAKIAQDQAGKAENGKDQHTNECTHREHKGG
jgi:hypothetical protein